MENNKKNNKEIKLTSLGAAQTVTGSKHLLEWDRHHFLIDCGLYQGQETKGWPEWDYQQFNQEYIRKIHAVFLTHAHLDHCGYLPKLIRDGFNGPIYATQATYELAEIIMRDAAKIAQNEARTKNKKINKESQKITPLYQTIHVEQTLKHFKIVNFNKPFNLGPFQITYHYAGHIPGASSVSLTHALQKKTILFSGDLGRHDDPLLRPPTPAPNADVVVVESTYGDRLHKRPENGHQGDHKENHEEELVSLIKHIRNKQSTLLIAAFSVQRTQLLFYYLNELFKKYPDLKIPIYSDSPMAMAVGKVFRHSSEFLKVSTEKASEIFQFIHEVAGQWDRESLQKATGPQIIVSSSGMMTGGFITTHFEVMAEDKDSILYLPGYMGQGTLGRLLADGAKEVKWGEKNLKVECRVIHSQLYSAHADQKELIDWIEASSPPDKNSEVIIIHGEEEVAFHFEEKLKSIGYAKVHIQKLQKTYCIQSN